MGYFLAFGVVAAGYTVLVWGHYIQQHEAVSMWYLLSGQGDKFVTKTTAGGTGPVVVTPGGKTSVKSPTSSGGRAFNPKGNIGAL